MVLRGPGAVGCAHCTKLEADRPCRVCTRLVCPTCAANWASCSEPAGRIIELGMTARVRDVDPLGHYALVSHWRRALRLFDLRTLAWVPHVAWERKLYLWTRALPPRLTGNGELVYAELGMVRGDAMLVGMRARRITDGHDRRIYDVGDERPESQTSVSTTGDLFHCVTDTQRVLVLLLDGTSASYEPLPRKAIHAAVIDGDRQLMAAATWSEIALHRMDGGKLTRLASIRTEREGDVHWLGLAGEWVCVAIGAWPVRIECHRLQPDFSVGPVERRFDVRGVLACASISSDGRHIAISATDGIKLFDVDTGTETKLDGHSGEVKYVRFATHDHVLVSCDNDNRVILRPRGKSRAYAHPLIPVDLE